MRTYRELSAQGRLEEFSRHQHDYEEGRVREDPRMQFNDEEEQEEKMRLIQVNPSVVIDYVKSTIDIMMSLKVEDDVAEYQQKHQNGPKKNKRHHK